MGRCKDLWVDQCARLAEAFGGGEIDESEFRDRATQLGIEADEIDEEIAAVREVEAA